MHRWLCTYISLLSETQMFLNVQSEVLKCDTPPSCSGEGSSAPGLGEDFEGPSGLEQVLSLGSDAL